MANNLAAAYYGLHLVTGKRFFAHYGLDVSKVRTFDAAKIEDGLVGFSLAGDDDSAEKPAKTKARSKPAMKKAHRQPAEAAA